MHDVCRYAGGRRLALLGYNRFRRVLPAAEMNIIGSASPAFCIRDIYGLDWAKAAWRDGVAFHQVL